MRAQIRLVGSPYGPDGGGSPIEPNLCSGAEDADACASLMRVEVLVSMGAAACMQIALY